MKNRIKKYIFKPFHFCHNTNVIKFHDRIGRLIEVSTVDYHGAVKAIASLH